jgi:uncharacterized OB-fold protein
MTEKQMVEDANRRFMDKVRQATIDTGLPLVPDEKTLDLLYVSSRDLPLKFIIPVAKVRPFFDALREGRLTATKCKRCGQMYFPPQADCFRCRSSQMEYVGLSREALLMAYTVINVKPFSFMQYGDYVVAIGRLPEGLNVLAWMKGMEAAKIEIGMKLKLVINRREPEGVYTYWFEPA